MSLSQSCTPSSLLALVSLCVSVSFGFFPFPTSLLLLATLKSKCWQAMNQSGLFLLLLGECLQHTENSACGLTLYIFSEKNWLVSKVSGRLWNPYRAWCIRTVPWTSVLTLPTPAASSTAPPLAMLRSGCSPALFPNNAAYMTCGSKLWKKKFKTGSVQQRILRKLICGLIKLFLLPHQPSCPQMFWIHVLFH